MKKEIEILKEESKKCIDFYKHYMRFVNDVTLNPKWAHDAENEAKLWKQRAQQTDYLIYILEEEATDQPRNKETDIIQRLKNEMSNFQKVKESNEIEAQREKRIGRQTWEMFHVGKIDAYSLIINVLKEIINDYDGKDM